jgi:hypothetical protein
MAEVTIDLIAGRRGTMDCARTESRLALVLVGLLVLAGCGRGGPPRYDLSGKVTHGGQPIPAGSVTFIPDKSKGNSGPAISVKIKEGQYDTSREDVGHVGGPHIVKITALDGKVSDEFSEGNLLFPDYEMSLDLPKEDGTQDLDVPADWVMPPQRPFVPEGP